MSLFRLMAKSDDKTTLEQHLNDCFCALNHYWDGNKSVLFNWLDRLDINRDDFESNLNIALFYHDFGKATIKWQKEINEENPKLPPHAPFAGYFILQENRKNIASLLASISHHSLLTEDSGCFLKKRYFLTAKFYEEELLQLNKMYGRLTDISFTKLSNYSDSFHRKFKRLPRGNWKERDRLVNVFFKARYCQYLFLITIADIMASKFEDSNEKDISILLNKEFPKTDLIKDSFRKIDDKIQLTKTQSRVISLIKSDPTKKNFVLEAPCGEGKTLSSLLFARELLNNEAINRIIFTLPTQTTTNNMVREFVESYHIPKDWIGIYHSEVFQFLQAYWEDDSSQLKSKIIIDSFYVKPINISTVDHLLLSLVNGYRYSPRAFGALQTSLVVIDEMHYYDPHTIGMIDCLCTVLQELKIPYFIMSATIPKIVKEKFLVNVLHYESDGKDDVGNLKKPYRIKYHKNLLIDDEGIVNKELFDVIDQNPENDICIIVNTVKKAKKVYFNLKTKYKSDQLFLYHSQFTRVHRPEKEKLLNLWMKNKKKPGSLNDEEKQFCRRFNFDPLKRLVFIGTQVVEISLNLSFDTIISELAPLDSLFQRGGRLHRNKSFYQAWKCNCWQCSLKNKDHEYVLHIFDTGEFCSPYYLKKNESPLKDFKKSVIENTRKAVMLNCAYSFGWGQEQLNIVYDYQDMFKQFDAMAEFWNVFQEDMIFGGKPFNEKEEGITRIRTRIIDSNKVEVLPNIFHSDIAESARDFLTQLSNDKQSFNKDENKFTSRGFEEISKHTLKVYWGEYKLKNTYWGIKVVDAKYNFEQGLHTEDIFC